MKRNLMTNLSESCAHVITVAILAITSEMNALFGDRPSKPSRLLFRIAHSRNEIDICHAIPNLVGLEETLRATKTTTDSTTEEGRIATGHLIPRPVARKPLDQDGGTEPLTRDRLTSTMKMIGFQKDTGDRVLKSQKLILDQVDPNQVGLVAPTKEVTSNNPANSKRSCRSIIYIQAPLY